MADEVRGQITNGNGERLSLQIGTKSFGIQARDILPILLLLMMGVGGYLLYDNVHRGIVDLQRNHEAIEKGITGNTIRIVEAIAAANRHREAQTEALGQMLYRHELNQVREPGAKLPLYMRPPAEDSEKQGK